jgi:peptidyl-prolyl cis-trans isomerase D
VFRADATALPAYVGVDLAPAGYTIYRISRVAEGPALDAAKHRAVETGLARLEARMGYEAFLGGLKARSDISINEANLARKDR